MKDKELAIALGVTRKMLRELRTSFEEFKHWAKIPSRKPENLWEIEWTDEGVTMLKQHLGLKIEEPIKSPELLKGKVFAKFNNKHIIQVLINEQKHNVICKDNTKFIPNMEVDVKWDGSRWCVVRHPRFNGKY